MTEHNRDRAKSNPTPAHPTQPTVASQRRRLLLTTLIGGSAAGPTFHNWSKPVIQSILLPSHAQSSPTPPGPNTTGGSGGGQPTTSPQPIVVQGPKLPKPLATLGDQETLQLYLDPANPLGPRPAFFLGQTTDPTTTPDDGTTAAPGASGQTNHGARGQTAAAAAARPDESHLIVTFMAEIHPYLPQYRVRELGGDQSQGWRFIRAGSNIGEDADPIARRQSFELRLRNLNSDTGAEYLITFTLDLPLFTTPDRRHVILRQIEAPRVSLATPTTADPNATTTSVAPTTTTTTTTTTTAAPLLPLEVTLIPPASDDELSLYLNDPLTLNIDPAVEHGPSAAFKLYTATSEAALDVDYADLPTPAGRINPLQQYPSLENFLTYYALTLEPGTLYLRIVAFNLSPERAVALSEVLTLTHLAVTTTTSTTTTTTSTTSTTTSTTPEPTTTPSLGEFDLTADGQVIHVILDNTNPLSGITLVRPDDPTNRVDDQVLEFLTFTADTNPPQYFADNLGGSSGDSIWTVYASNVGNNQLLFPPAEDGIGTFDFNLELLHEDLDIYYLVTFSVDFRATSLELKSRSIEAFVPDHVLTINLPAQLNSNQVNVYAFRLSRDGAQFRNSTAATLTARESEFTGATTIRIGLDAAPAATHRFAYAGDGQYTGGWNLAPHPLIAASRAIFNSAAYLSLQIDLNPSVADLPDHTTLDLTLNGLSVDLIPVTTLAPTTSTTTTTAAPTTSTTTTTVAPTTSTTTTTTTTTADPNAVSVLELSATTLSVPLSSNLGLIADPDNLIDGVGIYGIYFGLSQGEINNIVSGMGELDLDGEFNTVVATLLTNFGFPLALFDVGDTVYFRVAAFSSDLSEIIAVSVEGTLTIAAESGATTTAAPASTLTINVPTQLRDDNATITSFTLRNPGIIANVTTDSLAITESELDAAATLSLTLSATVGDNQVFQYPNGDQFRTDWGVTTSTVVRTAVDNLAAIDNVSTSNLSVTLTLSPALATLSADYTLDLALFGVTVGTTTTLAPGATAAPGPTTTLGPDNTLTINVPTQLRGANANITTFRLNNPDIIRNVTADSLQANESELDATEQLTVLISAGVRSGFTFQYPNGDQFGTNWGVAANSLVLSSADGLAGIPNVSATNISISIVLNSNLATLSADYTLEIVLFGVETVAIPTTAAPTTTTTTTTAAPTTSTTTTAAPTTTSTTTTTTTTSTTTTTPAPVYDLTLTAPTQLSGDNATLTAFSLIERSTTPLNPDTTLVDNTTDTLVIPESHLTNGNRQLFIRLTATVTDGSSFHYVGNGDFNTNWGIQTTNLNISRATQPNPPANPATTIAIEIYLGPITDLTAPVTVDLTLYGVTIELNPTTLAPTTTTTTTTTSTTTTTTTTTTTADPNAILEFPNNSPFKALLVGNANINTNGDAEIQVSEARAFSGTIDVSDRDPDLTELPNIEAFTALDQLICFRNSLISLDLSGNTALDRLICFRNSLTSLDLSGNTALIQLQTYRNSLTTINVSQNTALLHLNVGRNQLTTLDVSQNTELVTLHCDHNNLGRILDLSTLSKLGNPDPTDENKPGTLGCGNNDDIEFIILHRSIELDSIPSGWSKPAGARYVHPTTTAAPTTSTTTTADPNATTTTTAAPTTSTTTSTSTTTTADPNATTTTSTTTTAAPTTPPVPGSNVQIPDTVFKSNLVNANYTNLNGDSVPIDTNNDDEIQVSEAQAVTGTINVGKGPSTPDDERITDVTGLEAFTALTQFIAFRNRLTTIDVSKNTALTVLSLGNNQHLTALDVSKNTALTELYCDNNSLTTLDVSNNTALTVLECNDNDLSGALDLSNLTELDDLDASSNGLLAFIIVADNVDPDSVPSDWSKDGNTRYTSKQSTQTCSTDPTIVCIPDTRFKAELTDNTKTTLDANDNDEIETSEADAFSGNIDVNAKQIFDLTGIETLTGLVELRCYRNPLTALNLSANTALTRVESYRCLLATVNVSGATNLDVLSIGRNQLTTLDLSTNTALTELYCDNNRLTGTLDLSNSPDLDKLECQNNSGLTIIRVHHTFEGNIPSDWQIPTNASYEFAPQPIITSTAAPTTAAPTTSSTTTTTLGPTTSTTTSTTAAPTTPPPTTVAAVINPDATYTLQIRQGTFNETSEFSTKNIAVTSSGTVTLKNTFNTSLSGGVLRWTATSGSSADIEVSCAQTITLTPTAEIAGGPVTFPPPGVDCTLPNSNNVYTYMIDAI